MNIQELKKLMADSGDVGAGGAGFPSSIKLSEGADTLIINAYETHVFEYETEYEKELPRIRKKKEKELKIAEEKAKENQKRELKEEQKKEQIEDLKEEQIEEQQIEEQQIEEQREEIVLRAAEE